MKNKKQLIDLLNDIANKELGQVKPKRPFYIRSHRVEVAFQDYIQRNLTESEVKK